MTWLHIPYVDCRSAQELAASNSGYTRRWAATMSLSAMWRGKRMPPAFWSRAWQTKPWVRHLYGPTCALSTRNPGVAAWISSLPASPASPGARRAKGVGRTTSAICGPRSAPSSKSSRPSTSLSKTSPGSCQKMVLNRYGETYSAWVTRWRLASSARLKSARHTFANASSFLPTPTTPSGGASVPHDATWVGNTAAYATDGTKLQVTLQKAVQKMWPTPTASQAIKGSTHFGDGSPTLVGLCGGLLSPQFVEEMMGLPIGWTASELSATPSSPLAPPSLFKRCLKKSRRKCRTQG